MDALTSELAYQTRHPPPGESSPLETPDVTVQNESASSDQTGKRPRIPFLLGGHR